MLRPNTVMMGFPSDYTSMSADSKGDYVAVMRDAAVAGKTLLVCKGSESFPDNTQRMTGFIDIWCVLSQPRRARKRCVQGTSRGSELPFNSGEELGDCWLPRGWDTGLVVHLMPPAVATQLNARTHSTHSTHALIRRGVSDRWVFDILPARGLLLLIPYLLRHSKVWAQTQMRLFVVTGYEEDTNDLTTTLSSMMKAAGMKASVHVVQMDAQDAPRYTHVTPNGVYQKLHQQVRSEPSLLHGKLRITSRLPWRSGAQARLTSGHQPWVDAAHSPALCSRPRFRLPVCPSRRLRTTCLKLVLNVKRSPLAGARLGAAGVLAQRRHRQGNGGEPAQSEEPGRRGCGGGARRRQPGDGGREREEHRARRGEAVERGGGDEDEPQRG